MTGKETMKFTVPSDDKEDIFGDFGVLRNYLLAKFMWDPYITEEEYVTIEQKMCEKFSIKISSIYRNMT